MTNGIETEPWRVSATDRLSKKNINGVRSLFNGLTAITKIVNIFPNEAITAINDNMAQNIMIVLSDGIIKEHDTSAVSFDNCCIFK